jgi:glycerophosphoryl diester phosphodiesterase
MNTIKINAGKTLMVAHRGVSGLERENTVAAFLAAGNRSYYGMETDIYRTNDGNFILNHDGNLARIAGENLKVEEASYETLRRITLYDMDGNKRRVDLHLASLEEYVSICKRYEKVGVLELKSAFTDEEIAEIVARIESFDYLAGITFISFSYDNLLKVRAIRPEATCQFLTGDASDEMIARLVGDKLDLDVHHSALTEERIAALHAAGIRVNCWTVDDKDRAEELAAWGVDYITSNILEAEA